jgi:hypothetical protein
MGMTENFSRRLYNWTVHRAMTQKLLALKADLPYATVNALVMDERPPTASEVSRLAEALQITPKDLIDWS